MNNNWLNKAKEKEIQSMESFHLSKLQSELQESINTCLNKYIFEPNTADLSARINDDLKESFSGYFPSYTITVSDSNLENQVSFTITCS